MRGLGYSRMPSALPLGYMHEAASHVTDEALLTSSAIARCSSWVLRGHVAV